MPAHGLNEALLAELLSPVAERLRYAVCIKCESVSVVEPPLTDRAVPVLEESDNGCGGVQPLYRVVVAEEKPREMSAIRVAEGPQRVVIFSKKERGIGAI